MRHKHKRVLELNTGVIKTTNVLRTMLTNLVTNGTMKTTVKRSKSLKAFADSFFARLVRIQGKYDANGARRESIALVKSVLDTSEAGKKVVDELLPKYMEENISTGFVRNYKMGFRKGDASERVLMKLI